MLYPPGFYFVKKTKRFVISPSDKSSERNLSSFFDIKKPRRIEHLQNEEPFSSDPYFRNNNKALVLCLKYVLYSMKRMIHTSSQRKLDKLRIQKNLSNRCISLFRKTYFMIWGHLHSHEKLNHKFNTCNKLLECVTHFLF